MGDGGAFPIRSHDPDFAQRFERIGQRSQTGRVDPIVIGDQNSHQIPVIKKAARGSFFVLPPADRKAAPPSPPELSLQGI